MKPENTKTFISEERKTRDLQPAARMIMNLAKGILGKRGFVEVDMISGWDKIVGEELARYSFPQQVSFPRNERSGATLLIAVSSGAFALEIQHRETFIISKINTYFGYNAVARLKIIQSSDLVLSDAEEDSSAQDQKTLVTAEEENYIKALSKEISNPALQEEFERLAARVINHNRIEKKDEI